MCFGAVFLEGLAIYGITSFIGELLRMRGAGGLREAGFVIGGLGIGGLLYAAILPMIMRFAKRPGMMGSGGAIAAVGLAGVGLDITWVAQMARMMVLGFGFFLLHNSVQTEVTELAPSARASSFSLHAFSFFLGQALGPVVYGIALRLIGPTLSLGWRCYPGDDRARRQQAPRGTHSPHCIAHGLLTPRGSQRRTDPPREAAGHNHAPKRSRRSSCRRKPRQASSVACT